MPHISIVTPTFRREDLLARCVESVRAQECRDELEQIVVNDAGEPLTQADWMHDPRVTVVNTRGTERCVARNTGAALSRGEWLYFLDDDDYALPGALAAMLSIMEDSGAALAYGGYEIHSERRGVTQTIQPRLPPDIFARMFAGEGLPPPATFFARRAFFAAGGFDPLFPLAEDLDLVRRVAFTGPAVGTDFVVARARVEHETSTTRWERYREYDQRSLQKCLRFPQVLPRLLRSTRQSPYWRGRCARQYVAAALHAARSETGDAALAPSYALAALRLSGGNARSSAFWRGLRRLPEA